jgi:hypothetical protein
MDNNITISDEELEALIVQAGTPMLPVPAPVPDEAKARRDHRWIVYGLRANLYWQGREYLVKICDVSLSGFGLEVTPKVMHAGTTGILVLDLEEYGILATPVAVLRVEDGNYSQQVGVHLLPCEPEDLSPLTAYIDNLVRQACNDEELNAL